MTYSTEDLSRMEKMFKVDSDMDKDLSNLCDDDFIELTDVEVHDISGMPVEKYAKIGIPKRWPEFDGKQLEGTLDDMITTYNTNYLKVPSFPLFMNILTKVEAVRKNVEFFGMESLGPVIKAIDDVDFPYKIENSKCTNTIIDFDRRILTHYPMDVQGTDIVFDNNEGTRTIGFHNVEMLEGMVDIDVPLKYLHFFQNLTGFAANVIDTVAEYHGIENIFSYLPNVAAGNSPGEYSGQAFPKLFKDGALWRFESNGNLEENYRVPFFKVIEQ